MEKESSYIQYKQAFRAYYQPLCQYAHTLVASAPDCEDMVQELFLHIWEKKQDLLGQEALRFYLFRATRNRCLNYLRKNKKLPFTQLAGLDDAMGAAAGDEPEKSVDLAGAVTEALGRLPVRCREVFVLSRLSRLTYQQIAETLGISVKTVDNQIGKALKIMRSFAQEKQLFLILLLIISLWFIRQIGISALCWSS